MRRGKYAPPADHTWVTVREIATGLGLSTKETVHLLKISMHFLPVQLPRRGRMWLFPADTIEILRGLLNQPHRTLAPPEKDWLSQYLEIKE